MNPQDIQNEIQLVYEGPQDESPDTLRKIKSTFVADLNYSIDDTRRFIEEPPCVVISTIDEDLVQQMYNRLQAAGARVLLVKPQEIPDNLEERELMEEPVLLKSAGEEEDGILDVNDEEEAPQTFEIELDLTAAAEAPPQASKPKVYELKGDQISPAGKPPQPMQEKPPEKKKEAEPLFSFEEISKALEESQKTVDEHVDTLNSSLRQDQNEEIDLSFDDAPPVSAPKKESLPPSKPAPTQNTASTEAAASNDLFPEIVVESEEPSIAEGGETDLVKSPPEETQKLGGQQSPPRLSDVAARVGDLARARKAEVGEPPAEAAPADDGEEFNWKKETPLWREVGIPIVVLGAILGGLTWYYFRNFAPVPEGQTPAVTSSPAITPVQAAQTPQTEPTPVPKAPSNRMKGRNELSDRSLSAEMVLDGEAIKILRVEVSTMPPPALTSEQIIHNEKQKPWLKRVEIEETAVSFQSKNHFSANSPGKAYVENDKQSTRVIATAALSGTWNDARDQVSLHVEVSYNTAGNSLGEQEIIRRVDEGGVAFSISGDVVLKRE